MLAFGAIAETAIAAVPDTLLVALSGVVTYTAVETDDIRLYVATEEYISRSSDTPSAQPFDGTLEKLPQFDRSIISGDGFEGLTNGWGSAGVINVGDYDKYIAGYAVDGRAAVFKAFDPDAPYDDGFIAASLIARTITVNGQTLTVDFQDKVFKLNVPTQPNVYGGTGELEGGTELTGKRRNMALGRVKNITPVLLIGAELVLEVNGGNPVQSIDGVYDLGYPLTFSSNYATTTLLRAAAIADGSYATCVAEGRLRAGAAYSQLTCDVHGDATGGYVETTGTIIRRIIALAGCISDPSEVDIVSFANLELDQPAPIGYYLAPDSTETVADTLNKLSKGIGGFCGFTRLGMLQGGVFTAPSGTPVATFPNGCPELIDIDVEKLPSAFDPPPWRQRVIYDRNWTVIDNPVAGAAIVDADRAAWMRTPYRVATTSEAAGAAILEDHLQAQDPNVRECFFALLADALAFATSQLTLANSGYVLYRVKLKVHPFTQDICQTIRITDDRFGLQNGKLLRIPAISDIPDDNTVELRVFG